jgi:hypothetical protein
MSVELKDFRGRITPETDCAIEAESRVSGKEKQEIVREILHGWALNKIREATVLHRLLVGEGLGGITEGSARNPGGARTGY